MTPENNQSKSKLIRIVENDETQYLGIVTEENGKRKFMDIIGSHKKFPNSGRVERIDVTPNSQRTSRT